MNPFRTFSIDHFVPLANGGIGRPPNLVPACVSCNGAKRDRLPDTFFHSRGPELVWMAKAAVEYYQAVIKLEREGLATYEGVPIWITAKMVVPPEPRVFVRRARIDVVPDNLGVPDA